MRASPGILRTFGLAWLVLSLLAGAWSFATPISAAPDEPAHFIKAASVVRGQFIGESTAQGHIVRVPQYVAYTNSQTCFAFKPDVSAECSPEVPGDSDALVDAITSAGLYNPVYYAIVGWPSLLFPDGSGIFAMRLVSAIAVSLFLALAFTLIASWRRPALPLIGFAVAVTPMVLFLGGTVNPNSLEVAATLAAFVGLLTIVREPRPDALAAHATIVAASAAIAANMRGLSLLWLAIALLVPFVLVGKRRIVELARSRPVQIAAGVTLLAAIGAAVWVFASNSLGANIDRPGEVTNAPGVGTPPLTGFFWTVSMTFHYWKGIVGVFGWLDTPAPEFVYFAWTVLGGGLAFLGLALLRGRQLVLIVVLIAAVLVLPPILQGAYITEGGIIWQGRYILPLFVCAVVALGAVLSDRLTDSARPRLVLLAAVLWGIAQLLSFATTLRRYAVGNTDGWSGLLSPDWQPPGGTILSLVTFGLVVSAAVLGWWWVSRDRRTEDAITAGSPTR